MKIKIQTVKQRESKTTREKKKRKHFDNYAQQNSKTKKNK